MIIVEDASDSELEDDFNDPWHNRRPAPGVWIEPVEGFDGVMEPDQCERRSGDSIPSAEFHGLTSAALSNANTSITNTSTSTSTNTNTNTTTDAKPYPGLWKLAGRSIKKYPLGKSFLNGIRDGIDETKKAVGIASGK